MWKMKEGVRNGAERTDDLGREVVAELGLREGCLEVGGRGLG